MSQSKRLFPNSGIYRITNIRSGDTYVGASSDTRTRKSTHLGSLRKGSCKIAALLAAFAPFNEHEFKFEVLELCTIPLLQEAERRWIQELKPNLNTNLPSGKADANCGRPVLNNAKTAIVYVRFDAEEQGAIERYRDKGKDLAEEIRAFVRRRLKAEGVI